MTKVVLREINQCTSEQKVAVRDIRNQDSVRRSMYTDHEIGLDEHLKWVDRLKDDKNQIVFVVLVEEVVSGVVSVNAIDRSHKKSDWAFYLSEKVRGGLGAALEFSLLDFVFNTLLLEKLNCEVIETNEAVVKMHKKFCFVEEGFRRENIEKEGGRVGVFFLGITKSDWLEGKSSVREKYQPVLNKFNITIEY
jgi:UDP-4-amino-4,6-dideoxy-N-acetyl-beta-L-altrosamine N-acetyltransferase